MATTPLTHKELAKHLRVRIGKAGIKARVQMQAYCGEKVIVVVPPTYEASFTYDEQKTIRLIAQVNHLTFSRGMPIVIDAPDTDSKEFRFYLGYA